MIAKRNVLKPAAWLGALALVTAAGFVANGPAAAEGRAIPAPAVDESVGAGLETVTLAGGCFWGVQGVFQHVDGVTRAVSGYAGGASSTATYAKVGDGDTGHAEAVQVTFDRTKVSLGKILQVYFSVAHDPTTLNRQGPDRGQQYRSAVFASSAEQARIAKAYVAQLDAAGAYGDRIVTKVEQGQAFYPAEAYHQDYMVRNPRDAYIVYNDAPKVEALRRLLPDVYRATPALVSGAGG
ncbi:peptide-methionine (S)-S-oxide reductase MsrA [Methylopila sp. M107]|uniref:peptide-methionine (S)-S-oxide reductase MsrA n=1 Tax=Methylopila sp. M107 TaxID=1101190 RepID=UPI000368FF53|nr:peptide-methionine (S)-S-oxide reductase MsrA [Methylopila sp. M107]